MMYLSDITKVYRGAVISTLYGFPRYQRVLIDLSYPLWTEIKKETTEMKTILLSVVFYVYDVAFNMYKI